MLTFAYLLGGTSVAPPAPAPIPTAAASATAAGSGHKPHQQITTCPRSGSISNSPRAITAIFATSGGFSLKRAAEAITSTITSEYLAFIGCVPTGKLFLYKRNVGSSSLIYDYKNCCQKLFARN